MGGNFLLLLAGGLGMGASPYVATYGPLWADYGETFQPGADTNLSWVYQPGADYGLPYQPGGDHGEVHDA